MTGWGQHVALTAPVAVSALVIAMAQSHHLSAPIHSPRRAVASATASISSMTERGRFLCRVKATLRRKDVTSTTMGATSRTRRRRSQLTATTRTSRASAECQRRVEQNGRVMYARSGTAV